MPDERALLTDTERDWLVGEAGDERQLEAIVRIRRRIQEELIADVEFLAEHNPELLEELRMAVCPPTHIEERDDLGPFRTVERAPDSETWDTCPNCGATMDSRGTTPDGEVFVCRACDVREVWVRADGA